MCKYKVFASQLQGTFREKKEKGGTAATLDMLLDSLPTKPEMFTDDILVLILSTKIIVNSF